jgi:hypothetical protein
MTADAHAAEHAAAAAANTPGRPDSAAPRTKRRRGRVRWGRLVVGLLVLAALVALWVRSRRDTDYFVFFTPAGNIQGVASDRRGVFVAFSNQSWGRERGLTAEAGSVPAEQFEWVRDAVYDSVDTKSDRWGFGLAPKTPAPGAVGAAVDTHVALRLPHWVLVAAAAVMPLRALTAWRRAKRRRRRGQCVECGYDLRSIGSGRCPECGAEV